MCIYARVAIGVCVMAGALVNVSFFGGVLDANSQTSSNPGRNLVSGVALTQSCCFALTL